MDTVREPSRKALARGLKSLAGKPSRVRRIRNVIEQTRHRQVATEGMRRMDVESRDAGVWAEVDDICPPPPSGLPFPNVRGHGLATSHRD